MRGQYQINISMDEETFLSLNDFLCVFIKSFLLLKKYLNTRIRISNF